MPRERIAYRVLADELRAAIRDGRFAPGDQLPTESQLAADHGLSRQTVRRAFLELVSDGLVERVRGRGTFVAEPGSRYLRQFGSVEDLMGLALDTDVEVVAALSRVVDIEAAARLGLPDDVVHRLSYVRSHRGVPFAWTTVSLRPRVAVLLEDVDELTSAGPRGGLTVIGLLEGRLPSPITSAEQSITAVAASARAAGILGVEEGDPLLRIDRLFVDAAGDPVELSIGLFLPAQYSYRISLRRAGR